MSLFSLLHLPLSFSLHFLTIFFSAPVSLQYIGTGREMVLYNATFIIIGIVSHAIPDISRQFNSLCLNFSLCHSFTHSITHFYFTCRIKNYNHLHWHNLSTKYIRTLSLSSRFSFSKRRCEVEISTGRVVAPTVTCG